MLSYKKILFLTCLFSIPRIVRIIYPQVWIEDPFLFYSSQQVLVGKTPYLDFYDPQFPGITYILTPFYALFGNSYRVPEILTQAVILTITWIVYAIGKRIKNETVGISSALILSFSSLLFRYHVWASEIWLLLLIATFYWFWLRWQHELTPKKIILLCLLLSIAISIKLTAVVPLAVIVFYIAVIERQIKVAIKIGVLTLCIALCLLSGFLIFLPEQFILQTIVFQLVKSGELSFWQRFVFPREVLDFPLILGILGAFVWFKKDRQYMLLPFLLAFCEWLFFTFAAKTTWPHNYIPLLLFLSLSSGFLINAIVSLWRQRNAKIRLSMIVGAIVLLFLTIPIKNLNWVFDAKFGFGYLQRSTLSSVSKFIADNTKSEDKLLIPQYIAVQSNRHSVMVDWPETIGIMKWIESLHAAGFSFAQILKQTQRSDYAEQQRFALPYGWQNILQMLQAKKIKFVILDIVRGETMPFSSEQLIHWGYTIAARYEPFIVWQSPLRN